MKPARNSNKKIEGLLQMVLVLLSAAVLSFSPCAADLAYRKHRGGNVPELKQACAIERAVNQLRDWPPPNPHDPTAVIPCGFGPCGGEISLFDNWAKKNSSPAAHQLLRDELADMCVYAVAVDLRFLRGYCSTLE